MKSIGIFFIGLAANFFMIANQIAAQDIAGSLESKFSKYKATAAKERLLVLTDRDVYEPGEIIWVDITAFDIFEPKISGLSNEVTVSFLNQKNYEVFNKKVILKNGQASSFLQLPAGIVGGVYQVKAMTANSGALSYYHRKVVLRENSLPRYLIETSFPDKEYIPGDQFAMSLQFKDFYNEPLKNVAYQVEFYDGGKKVTGITGKTNKTGQGNVNVKVPLNLKTGFFSYRVTADSKSGSSTLSGKFPVLSDQLFIDFFPENGKLIDGMETEIKFHAYDINGMPITIEADLLENNQSIQTFTSDSDGLGSFVIQPDAMKKYHVQMKRPLLLDKMYDLPAVEAKGVQLKVLSKSAAQAKYKFINGYQSVRSIYVVGIAAGEIFWKSEHELDRELEVDIDLSKASGPMAHLIVFNAAEHVEGEHILAIPGGLAVSSSVAGEVFSSAIREENRIELKYGGIEKGKVVFTAVNAPWILDELVNQRLGSMALPHDLYRQLVFEGEGFNGSDLDDKKLEKYLPYYVPDVFSMDRIMSKQGAFSNLSKQIAGTNPIDFVNTLLGQYREETSEGKIKQINMLANDIFATSNPNFVASLYQKKKEKRRPPYKEMLDKNVPVMDVLQAVKPYILEGNNIVFLSSARSISSQGGALIVIDGIASGTDPSAIRNLNPLHVESISASTDVTDIQRYTALNSVGVIEITTKTGEKPVKQMESVEEDQQFTAPDYSTKKTGPEDYRKTLNWMISEVEDGASARNQVFYNSDLLSGVKGRVYVIPANGIPFQLSFERELK